MRHKHKIRQTIINYLLSFILMLSLVVVEVMPIGKINFLSERAVLHASEKTHYYFNLKNEVENEEYVDFEEVKEDTNEWSTELRLCKHN